MNEIALNTSFLASPAMYQDLKKQIITRTQTAQKTLGYSDGQQSSQMSPVYVANRTKGVSWGHSLWLYTRTVVFEDEIKHFHL